MGTTVLVGVAVLWLVFKIGMRLLIKMNPNIKDVSANEAHQLIDSNKDMVILDVRTKREYNSGHIPGAILIPVNELSTRIKELTVHYNKPILVYCASGGRSPGAIYTLRNNFAPIYHLSSGLSSWNFELSVS